MTAHPPPPFGDEARLIDGQFCPHCLRTVVIDGDVLAPDGARAVAALIAAVDAWNAIPNDWDDHDAETAIIKALADPALAAVRRTLAGEG
jgi:hypothetical protein